MKKILFPLVLAVLLSACSIPAHVPQGPDNFQIKGHTVIWQKTYNAGVDQVTLMKNLIARGVMREYYEFDDYVCFHTVQIMLAYDLSMFRGQDLPVFVRHPMEAFVTIQLKEGRYRVTVEQIMFTMDRLGSFSLASQVLAGEEFKPKFTRTGARWIMDTNIDALFTGLDIPRLDDNF